MTKDGQPSSWNRLPKGEFKMDEKEKVARKIRSMKKYVDFLK
jgi:hypothetical protein